MPSRPPLRRATASAWSSANPILSSGELGYELDTGKFKVGDGATAWNFLSYGSSASGSGGSTSVSTLIKWGND